MDFYVILGLKRGASPGEVKRAYKRVARRYHPDINPGDGEAAAFYRRATEAYETLVDPDRRQEYDIHGVASPMNEPATVEFQGFDFSASGTGGGVSATFRELFSEVLEQAAPGGAPAAAERGSDVHGEIALGFDESLAGTERRLAITRLEACEGCGGDRPPPGDGRPLRHLPWHRDHALAARAHDLRQVVRRLRRVGADALSPVRRVRRRGNRGARHRHHHPGAGRRQRRRVPPP